MKNTLLLTTLLSLLSTSLAIAQTETGSFYMGGNTFLTSNIGKTKLDANPGADEVKIFSINFNPTAQFFIIDNLSIGASIPFEYYSSKRDDFESNSTSFGFNPLIRYYFGSASYKPYIGAQGGLSTVRTKGSIGGDANTEKGILQTINAGAGIAIFLKERAAIDIGIGYDRQSYVTDGERQYTTTGVLTSIGFLIRLN